MGERVEGEGILNMVKLTIVASGTRGDVQPYVALGVGLKAAGYAVRVLSSDNFERLVTDAGLEFGSSGESVETVLESEEWRKILERGNFITILGQMNREMKKRATVMAQTLPDLLAGSDAIITGMGGYGGVFSAAEKLHLPVIQAYVFPFSATKEFPSPLVPSLPFGRALNRLSFHVTHQMFWQTSKAGDVATRQVMGMGKGAFWGPFTALSKSSTPVLYGYSRHVLPRPSDWADNLHVTGYWFLDAPHGWTPPADLTAFLDAGSPPIYIGFGSMKNRNPEEAGNIALEALQRTGQRGVLATGWGGLNPSALPDSVHVLSSIPHTWLFPRMGAVVHHGGAGTTAAGLASGVPSIIIPFMGDQPFWGKRVADLGVGPTPIPRKKLTAQALADAIEQAMTNHVMRQKAATLAQNIRQEDGIANAVGLIERALSGQPAIHA